MVKVRVLGRCGPVRVRSALVKCVGQFFVFFFRQISFTMKWKHEQGYIYIIADEYKCISIPLT